MGLQGPVLEGEELVLLVSRGCTGLRGAAPRPLRWGFSGSTLPLEVLSAGDQRQAGLLGFSCCRICADFWLWLSLRFCPFCRGGCAHPSGCHVTSAQATLCTVEAQRGHRSPWTQRIATGLMLGLPWEKRCL